MFPELASLLEISKDTRARTYCYWLLSDIALQTGSLEIGAFVAKRVGLEKTQAMKTEALRTLAWTIGVDSSAVRSD